MFLFLHSLSLARPAMKMLPKRLPLVYHKFSLSFPVRCINLPNTDKFFSFDFNSVDF